jgi:hypothetical protein
MKTTEEEQTSSNQWDARERTRWQLRDELLRAEELRRVHDATVVELAQREGLFLSPAAWSRCLYRGLQKTAYFQSILDRMQVELSGLVRLLLQLEPHGPFGGSALVVLGQLAVVCSEREHEPSVAEVQCALQAAAETLTVRLTLGSAADTRGPAGSPECESWRTVGTGRVCRSATLTNDFPFELADWSACGDAFHFVPVRQEEPTPPQRFSPHVATPGQRPIRGRGASMDSADEALSFRPSSLDLSVPFSSWQRPPSTSAFLAEHRQRPPFASSSSESFASPLLFDMHGFK